MKTLPSEFADAEIKTTTRAAWLWPLGLLAAAVVALTIDLPLGRWALDGGLPKWLMKLCSLSEIFAHGLGVAMIVAVIFTLDPARRPQLPRVLAAAFGAGLAANVVKLLVARARPHHFDFVGGVFETFGAPLPFARGGSGWQSFPSSHAAVAAGLVVALAWLYPHGRRLFVVLALLACLQRLSVGAHFLSDVLVGCAVGHAWGMHCIGDRPIGRLLDRWLGVCGPRPHEHGAISPVSGESLDPVRRRVA